ncbi:MAG TPA: hypothetical protein VJA27_03750 [Patescibacteria group bacterium]|nr:hypothetical protein [Patescibacteria group bacterium]
MFFINLFLGFLLFILFLLVISALIGVPFLPTNSKQAKLMMDLAEVGPKTRLVDLGSGAGRLLFLAAGRGASAIGYELNPFLYYWTKLFIFLKGYTGKVEVRLQSLYTAEVGEADVVTAFLFNEPMRKLEPKLWREMRAGAKVVSYTFPILNRQHIVKEQGIYVYEIERSNA